MLGFINRSVISTLVHRNVVQHLEIPPMWAEKEKTAAEREESVQGKKKRATKHYIKRYITINTNDLSDENKCFCLVLYGTIFKQPAKGDLGSMCEMQQMAHTACR